MPDEYIMESSSEGRRILKKTDVKTTLQQLKNFGLRKGMHPLDVGCASGVTTIEMAKLVYPSPATGIDRSKERIREARILAEEKNIRNIEFYVGDVYSMPFPPKTFDFVWSRFLFEYLKEPVRALLEMKRVATVEGKVITGDLDGNSLFHYPIEPSLEKGLHDLISFLSGFGFDPFVGRKLFHYYRKAGFSQITPYLVPHHLIAGVPAARELDNWNEKRKTISNNFGRVHHDKEKLELILSDLDELVRDPDVFTYSVLIFMEGSL